MKTLHLHIQRFQVSQQTGAVIFVVVLCLFVLIGSVGLAINAGMGYLIKARLNAAVDSAAIAAVKAVTVGATQEEQSYHANVAANNFFNANYPQNFLGSQAQLNPLEIDFSGGKVTITSRAKATLPTSFIRVLDDRLNLLTVAASAESVRKDLDLAFVIDTTSSIITNPSDPQRFRDNAKLFLTKLNPLTDRVALIQFASGAILREPFRYSDKGFNLSTISQQITNFGFGGTTNSAEALWLARDQLNHGINPSNRSSLRVIVFFSDGAPNTFSGLFKFNDPTYCTTAGAISSSDLSTPSWPYGLWNNAQISTRLSDKCAAPYLNTTGITDPGNISYITELPEWYNAHNPNNLSELQEFRILPGAPRPVTNLINDKQNASENVNRVSRNLAEAIAAKARSEGIYVFALGLGAVLKSQQGPDMEIGENVLKCMANNGEAVAPCAAALPNETVGMYCYAINTNALAPCFDKLASAILRLSK